jgi:anti-sigma factor RsiW
MSPDLDTLRAFADGELAPERRAEIEAAIAADPETAAAAAALFASRLPYRSAFESQPLPPVPAELQARVAELVAVAAGQPELAMAGGAPAPSDWRRSRVLSVMLALLLGLLGGYGLSQIAAPTSRPQIEPWLRSVVTYHAMYARETVTDSGADAQGQLPALRKAVQDQFKLDLNPPDLSAQGLKLVRAQRLHFEGRTVLQLVYLPQQGAPVALCLMPAPNQPERQFVQEGQQALSWHADGWAHVLIGSLPPQQMQAIRKQLPASAVLPRAIG